MSELNTAAYWNKRVRSSDNLQDILFLDPRRDAYWFRVRRFLEAIKDKKVLDVCCGWGQFSNVFEDYLGIDVSSEMLKLASERNPGKFYCELDALNHGIVNKYDVVFEVNSLHSLGLTPEQFFELYKDNAIESVACLECDKFTIFQKYGR